MTRKIFYSHIILELIRHKITRYFLWALAISIFVWASAHSCFRDEEGFPNGAFCFPVSVGVALLLLGWAFSGRYGKSASWFALALVGQAAALQLIEAGPFVRYQHYKPFYRLLTESHPVLLIFLFIQTVLVVVGIKNRWSIIRDWLRQNFKFWQLLCVGLIFFLSSATMSRNISKYLIELLFASFFQAVNLGNIILLVWALPESILNKLNREFKRLFCENYKEDDSVKKIRIDRFAILGAIWVIIAASTLNYFVYERHPHVPDEVTDYTRAKYFAEGVLTSPTPSVPEAFEIYLMQVDGDRYYPVASIGWPAVLSLGILLGVPWLVNPVLAGLNLILIYLLLQVLFSRYVARVSLFLLCVSPWYIFMGMSFMTHLSSLAFALCATLAVEKARRSGKTIWGWFAGGLVGIMSLIRPLEGLIVAILLGLWSIGLGGKRLKFLAITGLVIGSMMAGSVVLFYNNYLTGDPTAFPLNAYLNEKFGPNSNALGFGPDRGMGWAIDPFPGHGPIDALVNANLNTFSINIELFGWSTGSLILVAILLFSGVLKRPDYVMIVIIIAVFIPHFFYYFSGGPDFGARYWFLMIIPFVVLTVRGIETLQTKLDKGMTNTSFVRTRVKVGVLSLCLCGLVNYFPWRAIDKYHHYRGQRPDIRELAAEYGFGKSLVLIRGDSTDYPSAWFYNPVNMRANAPIYAWDKNQNVRTKLLNAYPDRPVWIINGPSITHGPFKIIDGPLSPSQVREKNG